MRTFFIAHQGIGRGRELAAFPARIIRMGNTSQIDIRLLCSRVDKLPDIQYIASTSDTDFLYEI